MSGFSGGTFDPSRLTKSSAAQYSSSDSESDDDHRAPGIGQDDDFGDFNPRKKRRIGGNNKEKAALGVFASDSDDDGPGKAWKRKSLRGRGLAFVSSAKQDASSDGDSDEGFGKQALRNGEMDVDEKEDDKDEEDDEEDDDGDEEDDGPGLGFGGASRNMAWMMGGQPSQAKESPKEDTAATKRNGFSAQPFVPSSDRAPKLDPSIEDGPAPSRNINTNKAQVGAFSSSGKVNKESFGARMMAKMGFKDGGGLGKEGQGRNLIIEANLRPQGAGLGAVKELNKKERDEQRRQAKLRGEEVEESEDEAAKKRKKAKQRRVGSGTTTGASTPRKQKTRFLTVQEAQAAAPGLHIPEAFAPILDMTGPGSRMLQSASGIMTPTTEAHESENVIETRKLARRAQTDLFAFSEEWRMLEERKRWVNLELTEREREMADLQSDFDKLQLFSTLVSERLASATEWKEVVACLDQAVELRTESPEIADIAVAVINPFFRDSGWDPLLEPTRFAADLKGLSGLLLQSGKDNSALDKNAPGRADGVYRRHNKATTPFESLMYKTWLPQVLAAVRTWDPQDPDPMLTLLDNWNSLLPSFIRGQLMAAIARKLDTAISDWNPRKRRHNHLPHTWLFPWLDHLPAYHLDPRGTGLVSDVRRKFRTLADAWDFERGVVPGLADWREVLGDQWRPLIMSHVLPAMGRYVGRKFRVDPADQEASLPVLMGAMAWREILGDGAIAEVLVQHVFPGWHGKLKEWLALEEVDLSEVAEWYTWWRSVLLADLEGTRGVSGELDKGMRIMNMV